MTALQRLVQSGNSALVGDGTNDAKSAVTRALVEFAQNPDQAGQLSYTPGTPADWDAPAPTTVAEALDRLATAVEGLLGGAIPLPPPSPLGTPP